MIRNKIKNKCVQNKRQERIAGVHTGRAHFQFDSVAFDQKNKLYELMVCKVTICFTFCSLFWFTKVGTKRFSCRRGFSTLENREISECTKDFLLLTDKLLIYFLEGVDIFNKHFRYYTGIVF